LIASFCPSRLWVHNIIPLALALLVSFFEVIQQFVSNRSFDWFDLLANFTGMMIGTVVGMGVRSVERRA